MAGPGVLAAWLRRLGDEDLGRLCMLRPDLLHPLPADFDALAARMYAAGSLAAALDPLDRWTSHVLQAVMVLGTGVTQAELVDVLHAPASQVADALDRLSTVGLVWPTDLSGAPGFASPASLHEVLRYPCGLGPSVRGGHRARRPGAVPSDRPRAATSDPPHRPWWSAYPIGDADRERLTASLHGIALDELDVLHRLAEGHPVGVRSRGGPADPDPDGTLPKPGGHVPALAGPAGAQPAPDRIDRLVESGLLLAQPDGTVVLPGEVALLLRGDRPLGDVSPTPPTVTSRRVPGGKRPWDVVGGDAAATVVRLVEALLEMLAQAPAAQLRNGGLGVRELRRIATDLRLDQATAVLLLEAAHSAGLLTATHDRAAVWLPSPAFDTWLAKSTQMRWADLAAAWLTMPRAPGAIGLRDEHDRATNALGPDLAWWSAPRFRRFVLSALASLDEGHAAGADDLRELLSWQHPAQEPLVESSRLDDVLSEGETLGVLGRGAITAAGRALVAGSDERAVPPAATAGAADAVAGHLPQPVDHVLLQADLTAVAPGPLAAEVSRELALVADIESSGAASVYRFSPTSVRRALDAGRSTADVMAFLRATSRTPVPQTLEYLVADVGRRHGRMRVGTAQAFVRSDDEHLLAEVLANRRTHALRLRALAPTVLAAQAPVNQVLDILRRAGYAPAADGPAGASVRGRLRRGPAPSPRPQPWAPPTPSGKALATGLRALRMADQLHQTRTSGGRVHGQDGILHALVQAADAGQPLWISYVNADGVASRRVVEPLEVSGGLLTAFDHLRGGERNFAVHRIAAVGTVEWDADA